MKTSNGLNRVLVYFSVKVKAVGTTVKNSPKVTSDSRGFATAGENSTHPAPSYDRTR